jgi:hypothetical protein
MGETAVMKLLQYILVDCRNKDGVIQFSAHETFNEYLEIEKQQIIDAIDSFYDYKNWSDELPTKGKQYYNETFGKI